MRPARKGPETSEAPVSFADVAFASMRPARKGPETCWRPYNHIRFYSSFNEAGPQGAGNDEWAYRPDRKTGPLQ